MFRISYSNPNADIYVCGWTDVVITDDDKNLIMMSVAGNDSVVKALIAVTHNTMARYFSLEDPAKSGKLKFKSAHVNGSTRFRSMTSKVGDLTHGLVLCADAVAETESTQPVVIAWDGDMAKAFYETLVAKYPVPLLPEWSTYIYNECVGDGYVEQLTVSSWEKPILAARLNLSEENLKRIVKQGFRNGHFSIPEGSGDGGDIHELKDVTGYLTSYGSALANRLGEVFKPHHQPGIDELDPRLNELKRKPFRAQADVAIGIAKALATQKSALVSGEMGSGKTIVGISITHLLYHKAYRVLIQAPGHLVKKWKREVEITIPNAKGIILNDYTDVLALRKMVGTKPKQPEFYIISRDRAKLGYYYRLAAKWVDRRTTKMGGRFNVGAIKTGWVCPSCGQIQMVKKDGDEVPAEYEDFLKMKTSNLKCDRMNPHTGKVCGIKLWSADNKRVRRMAPAELMKKYFKGFFQLFIADEVHELKGSTAQGNSFAIFSSIAERTLGLTGTLLGGYASNLFKILFRIDAKALLNEELEYSSDSKWVGRYGVLEKTYKSTDEDANKMSRAAKGKVSVKEKPGISPQVFTRFLLSRCAFLELNDLSANLPSYTELVEVIDMDPELEDAYERLAWKLKDELLEEMRNGTKRLLGVYLNTLLSYPDKPYDNDPIYDEDGETVLIQPAELEKSTIYAKEQRLIEIVQEEKRKGRRCLVYAQFTGQKDIQPRLAELLREKGLRVDVLRSAVKPENRESWVAERVRNGVDVLICNPKLVETGLDLLDFPSIIFFQTGYNLFTLRQASRRSWRIGQRHPVRVYFLTYKDTLQEAAIRLMGAKLEASLSLEGKFSEEGLRAMGDGLDLSSALAKALVEGMGEVDAAEAIWQRMGFGKITDDEEEIPEIVTVTGSGEVKTVKILVVHRPKRKTAKFSDGQQAWDFFAEGA